MKSFQNCPGSSGTSGGACRRISRSSNPLAVSVPANDSSTTKTTRWPRWRKTFAIPTQLLVGPKAPSGKKTTVRGKMSSAIALAVPPASGRFTVRDRSSDQGRRW
jgi:hypothetical protein